jgi:hypothetical protein
MTSKEKPQQSAETLGCELAGEQTHGLKHESMQVSQSLCAQGQTKTSRDRGVTHPPGHDTGRKGNRAHQARQGRVQEPRRGSANGEPLFAFPCQPPLLKVIVVSLGGWPACCLAVRPKGRRAESTDEANDHRHRAGHPIPGRRRLAGMDLHGLEITSNPSNWTGIGDCPECLESPNYTAGGTRSVGRRLGILGRSLVICKS